MSSRTAAQMEKQRIRELIRSRLRAILSDSRKNAAQQATDRLKEQPLWQSAQVVLGYLALRDELDLSPALHGAQRAGRTVALPRYVPSEGTYCAALFPEEGRSLTKALFGVLEPPADAPIVPLNRLDFVLVPGLAFDPCGRRLGRGKGFYDRLLAQVNGIKCGVALDEQIVDELPAETHDIAMNFILTPTRWLIISPARS